LEVVTDWTYIALYRRLRWADVGKAIDTLDEIQVILERILRSGWENGSAAWKHAQYPLAPRVAPGAIISGTRETQPDHRIRFGSVTDKWLESHGLERSVDDERFGTSWIVPWDFKIEDLQ
jgi:hypothetical protein